MGGAGEDREQCGGSGDGTQGMAHGVNVSGVGDTRGCNRGLTSL